MELDSVSISRPDRPCIRCYFDCFSNRQPDFLTNFCLESCIWHLASNQIGFVFSREKSQNAQNRSYYIIVKELISILPILKLGLFFIFLSHEISRRLLSHWDCLLYSLPDTQVPRFPDIHIYWFPDILIYWYTIYLLSRFFHPPSSLAYICDPN